MTEIVNPSYLKLFKPHITLWGYQIKAMDEVSQQFDRDGHRKFLLEMATGTGKTLLCAALIRRFLATRNAERVLFIVDRIELAKQTMEDFNVVLREYSPVIFKTARRHPTELLGSSVVVATIQSLMVDRRYRTEFTPFHFDLVINDEAHRSIYGDAREVVQFFQATRVGLTATPKAYLKNVDIEALREENPKALEARELRDSYHYFGCEPGFPTFRYDIVDAVKDPEGPFLCLPKIFDIRSDITTQALADNGWAVVINEQEENYKIQDLERKVFTPERNRVMCEAFVKHAQRDPAEQMGKSIIFAVNQNHATNLTKILNDMQPNLAVTITSRIPDASAIAKDFRDGKRIERVAVSVDMLSTGYNCRDLLNVVLMRPVFSPISNPNEWPVKLADEFIKTCEYGTSQKANEAGRGIPVLRMNNVTSDGQLDLEEMKTVELGANELSKQRLQCGDILFNRTNSRELVGKTGMWDGRFEAVAASYFIRIRVCDDIEDPLHFTTFMNMPLMKRRLAEMARGAVGQANINAKELRSIRVPVPPLPLQKEFARLVTEIRGMESEQLSTSRRLEDLFQSLLQRAFRGEL
jgi:superfamily II DNA or RNA helicase